MFLNAYRLRPIDPIHDMLATSLVPFWAELFTTTSNGVMNGHAAKSQTWQDIMPLHRRVLRLAASGNHTVIKVPPVKSEHEPDKAFPHLYFQAHLLTKF